MSETIAESIAQLDEDKTLELVRLGLEKGRDPQQIVEDLRKGVDEVGTQFAKSNLFLTDLIMAAEIFKGALRLLKPRLSNQKVGKTLGKVTIGTVKGDVHDIGKNIVVMTLETAGFEVLDLGVDVPPESFVENATSTSSRVIGLSVLMTTSFASMKETVDLIRTTGLRTKMMVGGGTTNETVAQSVGADAYGRTAVDAVRIAKEWTM